jgi:hypothetical protein
VEHEDGWRRDPFLRHESRYFADGRPTERVRDWGVESEDPSPLRVETAARAAAAPTAPAPPSAPGAGAGSAPAPAPAVSPWEVLPTSPPGPPPRPVDGPVGPPVGVETVAPVEAPRATVDAEGGRRGSGSPGGRWQAAGAAVLVVVALIVVFTAFHTTQNGPGSPAARRLATTTIAGRPSATTAAPPTTAPPTTVALPSAPQSSADAAANVLIASWASGNQARALSVATSPAVAALFGARYQSGMAGDRGCSSGGPPETCAFGPPGGASPADPLYSLTVSQAPGGGWYVSAVQVLG